MSRILIIEDEEAIADLEKDYLELSGFEVEICNRGDTGLTRALNGEFDLIILDLCCRKLTALISAGRYDRKRILRSLWYLQRKMILIRSEVWDWVQTII